MMKALRIVLVVMVTLMGLFSILGTGGTGGSGPDQERVANNLEVEVENVINLSKGDCLVSGSITWNPNKDRWVARVNHYNGTPKPGLKHPAFEYVQFLPVPDWEGYKWEPVGWEPFPCDMDDLELIYFGNQLEIEVIPWYDALKGDCFVSGSITWNPNKKVWEGKVGFYNETPKPGPKHPVFNYIKFLPVPDWEGTDWEVLDWEPFPCDMDNLEFDYFGNQLEIEVENPINPSKESCLVSGSITWNPEKGKWVARVNHYNNTLYPSPDHPVFEYVRFLPVPDWEGYKWEPVGWEPFPCDWKDLDMRLFIPE